MKKSKLLRKKRNELTANSASPHRPERQYKIPPTYGQAATRQFNVGTCERKLGEQSEVRGWRRRKTTTEIRCGGKLIARLGSGSRRRVYCEDCRSRRREAQRLQRLEKRMNRLGTTSTPSEQARESRSKRFLGKLSRKGAR